MGSSRKKKAPSILDLLAEVKRREQASANAPIFVDDSFPAQAAFIRDPAKFKAALCTRRSGKSYGVGLYLFKEAYENPGVTCLYIALTRSSAEQIMWRDVLKSINRRLNLNVTFNETDLTANLPNGSIIKLAGADASQEEQEKFLGQKYRLVCIDEAASFKRDLFELVHGALESAMKDLDGTIVLIGTPSNLKRGLYFRITQTPSQALPEDAPWSIHRWGQIDNPYMRDKFRADLAEIEVKRPRFKETALFRQHWLGQWVIESDKLVYRFNPDRNLYDALPPADYSLVMGVDLGYDDDSSFVLTAYAPHDPTLYIIETFKKPGMTITDVANTIRDFQRRYTIDQVVIDQANKQAVEEMRQHHNLDCLVAASKTAKFDFIDLLNDDFIQGKVKINSDCADIIEELGNLVLDERALTRTGKRQEHPACSNHLCFIAGTQVQTEQGLVEVQNVVPGMRVVTRSGLQPIIFAASTGYRQTMEITFSNGQTLTGTSDHPIWTPSGWVPLGNLQEGTQVAIWTGIHSPNQLNGTGNSGSDSHSQSVEAIKSISDIQENTSIERFGNTTSAPSHRDITSTTSTATQATTTSLTWSASPGRNTSANTLKPGSPTQSSPDRSGLLCRSPRRKPPNGINPPRAESSMPSGQDYMASTVSPLNVSVRSAESLSWLGSLGPGFAAGHVTRVDTGPGIVQQVYALTVDHEHEYVANGVLVSNCDAMLYAWRTTYQYLATPAPNNPKPGTPEWMLEQERQMVEAAERRYRPKSEYEFPSESFPGGLEQFPG